MAVLQFFARKEGVLVGIDGVKKIPKLESYRNLDIKIRPGGLCKFAKNGGSSVFDVTLAHKMRSQVLADIRRIEQDVNIEVTAHESSKK